VDLTPHPSADDWKQKALASFRRANDLKTDLDDALFHLTRWRLKAESLEVANAALRGRIRGSATVRQRRSQILILTSHGLGYEAACEVLNLLFPEDRREEKHG
jgi:hypothetical protein